jgi:predicted nucleic acid-binding protein
LITRLTRLYADRILPITLEIAREWGRLSALRPIPPEDGLLAATAHVHRLTLVTRNTKNVEGLGVSVLNPWI